MLDLGCFFLTSFLSRSNMPFWDGLPAALVADVHRMCLLYSIVVLLFQSMQLAVCSPACSPPKGKVFSSSFLFSFHTSQLLINGFIDQIKILFKHFHLFLRYALGCIRLSCNLIDVVSDSAYFRVYAACYLRIEKSNLLFTETTFSDVCRD